MRPVYSPWPQNQRSIFSTTKHKFKNRSLNHTLHFLESLSLLFLLSAELKSTKSILACHPYNHCVRKAKPKDKYSKINKLQINHPLHHLLTNSTKQNKRNCWFHYNSAKNKVKTPQMKVRKELKWEDSLPTMNRSLRQKLKFVKPYQSDNPKKSQKEYQ
jgi:hypothetical protein